MPKIIHVEIKDGLLLPSGFLAPASYTCILYLRVPETWLSGDELLESSKEAMLENLYGKSWRQGNEDGSRYYVFSMTTTPLSPQQVAERLWVQHQPEDRSHQYWYYHITDDGFFQKREQSQFNL